MWYNANNMEVFMNNLSPNTIVNQISSCAKNIENCLNLNFENENISNPESILQMQQENEQKISTLQKSIVQAPLSDILALLAVRLETFLSSLKINYSANFDFALYNYEAIDVIHFVDDIKSSLPLITNTIPITFTIEDITRANKKVLLPKVEVPLDGVQLDGKTLLEHLTPKFSLPHSGMGRVEIKIDNCQDLILPFSINKLCRFEGTDYLPTTPVTEAILIASQNYHDRKFENSKELI